MTIYHLMGLVRVT